MSAKEKEAPNPWKDSLHLPVTDFPMRASLTEREPERLKKWEASRLYQRIQEKRKDARRFVLHDGPPFANGDVHMGTALNKILKDLVVKSKTMLGFQAPFVPGWDCHGLPIEFRVVKESTGLIPVEVRRKSEEYARKYIDIQRASFKRLGVFGDWEKPYLTLDPAYEADIIRTFAKLVEQGLVYRMKRPVLWSFGAGTALAEAEVEYKDKVSPAVYVSFKLGAQAILPALVDASLVIWTTTPWTLPANLAIALHPEFDYVVGEYTNSEGDSDVYVIAKPLIAEFQSKTGYKFANELAVLKGTEFAGMEAQHPLLPRTSKVINTLFVTADTGTGAVHVAPGHGADDYQAGREHGLDILSPVDDRGHYTAEVGLPEFVGKHVFQSNKGIIELLKSKGALLGHEDITHQYPHCWRSKTPVIFRAVEQFFINVDKLRAQALAEIDKVTWLPAWGRNRIFGTVESRPDWCISRQRTWGVPLPVFYKADGSVILDAAVARQVADIFEKLGTNSWFEKSDAEWAALLGLPADTKRGVDTLDVWIDSGCSHVAVLDRRPELGGAPADLYLEATDQHRGWFQCSLLLSVAARGAAPYKSVITHGFVVDTSGNKVSKSDQGTNKNAKPMTADHYYNKYGADLVRLWVSSTDYQNEVPFSEELFEQATKSYRSIRNTLRVLLGNLNGFDVKQHAVSVDKFTLLDRWILERLNHVIKECREAYDAYDFRKVYGALNNFCTVDLSQLYIDITKDRLYCDATDSVRRRAAQTAMHRITESLCKLLAPILSFSADETWEFLGHTESVHLETFPDPDPAFAGDEAGAAVEQLLQVRAVIQQAIEKARQEKRIGSNLEASVEVTLPAEKLVHPVFEDQATLEEFFILSVLTLKRVSGAEPAAVVLESPHQKCARCWKHLPTVGQQKHADLCDRCEEAVS
ncbi:MAG: isoleucine--tRNA ligase [Verrucomicrobia bacterium]|nr:isoleucine--tRNA ligase [Verrucomicrobiota bacterium]